MKIKVSIILALFLTSTALAGTAYNVIDLGTLSAIAMQHSHAAHESYTSSINNNGQIVGDSDGLATLFDPTGKGNNINLCAFPGSYGHAVSINNKGQIVGRMEIWKRTGEGSWEWPATLFDATGRGNNINLGPGRTALAINDKGKIVGWAFDAKKHRRAVLFDATGDGNNIDLGGLGGSESSALSINDSNQIVGAANDAKGNWRATLFDPTGKGNNISLDGLRGLSSTAYCINNNGQIVGVSETKGNSVATLFDATGKGNNINLGGLGGSKSEASSINNNGQIVGYAENATGKRLATLFDATGKGANIDLNTLINPALGWTLRYAISINDNGWIVGGGKNPNGYNHAFLLTPIP